MTTEEPDGGRKAERTFRVQRFWVDDLPWWATAAALHLVFLLALTMVSADRQRGREKGRGAAPTVALKPSRRPPRPVPARQRESRRDSPLPEPESRPVVTVPEEARAVEVDIPELRQPTESLLRTYDPSLFDPAIGVGRSAPGVYGERRGKGSLATSGGSGATEGAVQASLEWLMRHQSPDGGWDARGFVKQCREACRNEDPRYGEGLGVDNYEAGVTGLALLAFAGNGYTHRRGARRDFVDCVAKGVEYLKRVQVHSNGPETHGRYSRSSGTKWTYEHAIATMAMAELLAISCDRRGLEASVRDAVRLCLGAQNDDHGYGTRGWRYGYKPGDNDVSVIGWMVLALKAASHAGLDELNDAIESSLGGALQYIERATDRNTGRTGYRHSAVQDNRAGNPGRGVFSEELSCMTSVGVLCRILTGAERSHSLVRKGVRILMAHPPRYAGQRGGERSTINFYYWYYGSYALFQLGGAEWDRWNRHMKEALLSSQRTGEACEAGSWDPIDEWGYRGGRVYATALNAMTLEVYYRFRVAAPGAAAVDRP